jgi:hypothetical protein
MPVADYPASSQGQLKAWHRPLIFVAFLALATLACISIDLAIVFDPDGNGSGVVHLEMMYPRDLEAQAAADVNEFIVDLAAQGWEDVGVESASDTHYRITAVYPFSADPDGKQLKDVLPEFTYTIREAENEYRYYKIEGGADFSSLEEFWTEMETNYAVNGIDADVTGSFFDVEGEILSAQEVRAMMNGYGKPSATISVTLPGQTPVDANAFWDNEDEYLAGDTNTLVFSWTPGSRAVAPLTAERRLEPLISVNPAQAQANTERVIGQFEAAIPSGNLNITGQFSGNINNALLAFFNGGSYTCSDYQGRVLRWLDEVRTSPDENVRDMLEGLDYGPIQTNGGGHRSVVLFPRGTDWRTTGTVLDPWPSQKPRAFPIATWGDHLWFVSGSNNPSPDEDAGHLYPHLTGETSSYPASVELQGDLSRGLARPEKILLVRSPVVPMLTFPDGRRIGSLPDGSIMNELPREIDMYSFPIPESPGDAQWVFFLPETEFEVELEGTGEGDFHVLVASADENFGYGPQAISAGESASFTVASTGGPSVLLLPDRQPVEPMQIAGDEIDAVMGVGLEDLIAGTEIEVADQTEVPSEETFLQEYPGLVSAILIMCFCVVGGTAGVGLIWFGLFRGRRKKTA